MSLPNELQLLVNSNNSNNTIDIKQKIVQELLSEDNLDRKTELEKPLKWAALTTIIEFLKSKSLVKSAKILEDFRDNSFKYLISHQRKGRKEYVEALKSILQSERDETLKDSTQLMKQ